MKKLLMLLFTLLLSFVLVACGSDVAEVSESEQQEESVEEVQKDTVDEQEEVDIESESDDEAKDVQEDENLRAVNTYTNKELGITGTAGPIEYEFTSIQLKEIEIKSEEAAALFEANVGDKIHAITIEATGENTSDDDIYFYLGQAKIITNTKEQLDPDFLLSEHIEGEYLGQVRHSGYNVYILENSTVDELETIEIRVSGPHNDSLDRLADDIKHVIEVNK